MDVLKRYGFWVGIALVLIGLVVQWILGVWGAPALIPLILGAILTVTGIAVNRTKVREIFGRQTTQYGLSSMTGVLIVIVLLVIVNLILSDINWRKDTTAAGQYSLAEQTVKVLRNLEEPVIVKAFDVETSRQFLEDRLEAYGDYSNNFEWEFIDPDKQPEIAQQYEIRSLGTIVIESGAKIERIDEYTEENLTNAIIKVTREETKQIYFTTGHGEHPLNESAETGMQNALNAIEQQNYVANEIFLAEQDSVPADASVVVIAGAETEFLEKELTLLRDFLLDGGNLMFLVDPEPKQGFTDFLQDYYFDIGDNIVVDRSGLGQLFGMGPAAPLVNTYTDHPVVDDFGVMTFFPLVRSVEVNVPDEASGYSGQVLAHTSENSWGETDIAPGQQQQEVGQDPDEMGGPVPVAAAMEAPVPGGTQNARILVFGDSDFATNRYYNAQGNGNLFMNGVNWLLQDEDLISVQPKSPEDRQIQLNQSQVRLVLILVIILLPVAILIGGGVVYWKRNKS